MPVKRLYVEAALEPGCRLALTDDAAHYLGRVLRAKPGEALRVFSPDGAEFDATVATLGRRSVELAVGDPVDAMPESPLRLIVLQAMSRNEKMDFVVQKAVELGATDIAPVAVERSVMRLDDARGARRLVHWRQVAVHAAQQCGRVVVPAVHPPRSLADALAATPAPFGIVADPLAARTLGEVLDRVAQPPRAARVLIGPEGGLTDDELARAAEAGLTGCRIGPRILRTETAAVTLMAALQIRFGDLAGGH